MIESNTACNVSGDAVESLGCAKIDITCLRFSRQGCISFISLFYRYVNTLKTEKNFQLSVFMFAYFVSLYYLPVILTLSRKSG